MFVKADSMAKSSILYPCGNRSKSNWIQWFRGVAQYLYPYSVHEEVIIVCYLI